LHRSNSNEIGNFPAIEFFSFEEATKRALLLKAAQRRRPRIICIDHDQMLPKIGAAEPAARRGPVRHGCDAGWDSAGKAGRMPEAACPKEAGYY
jgi:hypothetical protein